MNQQIKQQWLSALRSGEYTQGQRNLQTELGFCCLGVLCDLYAKETGTEWEVGITADDKPLTYYSFDQKSSHLPESVVKWAGLELTSPFVQFANGERCDLAVLNDKGSTFEEIAQVIEEKL